MKKFELNGIEYRFNEETGRYSKVEGGKTVRIGKAEYEQAASTPTSIKRIPAEDGTHAVEFAKIGTEYGVRFVGDEEYKTMMKEEVKMAVDPRDRADSRFTACFEFMGRRYWTKDAIIKGEKTKKARKRTPKDIAYKNEDLGVTLTAKQLDFCKHLPDTNFWEDGLDSNVWIDVLADEIGGMCAGKPMSVGAMVSTLREKNLVDVVRDDSRQGKPKCLSLTDLGKKVFKDLQIGE